MSVLNRTITITLIESEAELIVRCLSTYRHVNTVNAREAAERRDWAANEHYGNEAVASDNVIKRIREALQE